MLLPFWRWQTSVALFHWVRSLWCYCHSRRAGCRQMEGWRGYQEAHASSLPGFSGTPRCCSRWRSSCVCSAGPRSSDQHHVHFWLGQDNPWVETVLQDHSASWGRARPLSSSAQAGGAVVKAFWWVLSSLMEVSVWGWKKNTGSDSCTNAMNETEREPHTDRNEKVITHMVSDRDKQSLVISCCCFEFVQNSQGRYWI